MLEKKKCPRNHTIGMHGLCVWGGGGLLFNDIVGAASSCSFRRETMKVAFFFLLR